MLSKSWFILSFLLMCSVSLFYCAEEVHAAQPHPRPLPLQPTAANDQISEIIWLDENADGNRDDHEIGLANVVVEMRAGFCGRDDSQPYALAVTGPDGIYTVERPVHSQSGNEASFCLRVAQSTLPAHLILSTVHTAAPVTSSAPMPELNGELPPHHKNHAPHDYDFGYAPLFSHDQLIVGLFNCHDTAWLSSTAAGHGVDAIATSVSSDNACVLRVDVPPERQEGLRTNIKDHPRVAFVERDVRVRGQYIPNDPDYNNPALVFAPQQINAEQAWDANTGDPNLIIAILDTGVDANHEEFSGRLLTGYDYVNEDGDPADDNGHGTHVAGIVGAGINNGLGIAGMAGDSRLLPMKVLNQNNLGWWSDVAQAITDAVDQGAKVINLSISSEYGSTALENALQYAVDHDVLVVAAAGNEGVDELRYPTAYPHANLLRVGATKYNGERWEFSNFGPNIDLLAPGQFIRSTHWQPGVSNAYGFMTGTSMATPHAAGVAALLYSIEPTLTLTDTLDLLMATATDLGDPGVDALHGHGRIDAGAAVQALLTPPVAPGDCNADVTMNAGDISALTLEIFDGDGNLPEDAHGGTFPGSGPGCNANSDSYINAGDISCVTLIIFNGPGACTPMAAASAQTAEGSATLLTLTMPDQIDASPDGSIEVPIRVTNGNAGVNALAFGLDIDERWLTFDPTDASGDGLPDAVRMDAPAGFAIHTIYNPTYSGRELSIVLIGVMPDAVLPEEPFVTIEFTVKPLDGTGEARHNEAALRIANDPPPTAGVNGRAIELMPGAPLQLALSSVQTRHLFLPVVWSG